MKTALFLFVAILTMFVVGCDRTPRFTFVPFIEKQLDSTWLLSHGDIILVDHAPKDTIERVKMMIDYYDSAGMSLSQLRRRADIDFYYLSFYKNTRAVRKMYIEKKYRTEINSNKTYIGSITLNFRRDHFFAPDTLKWMIRAYVNLGTEPDADYVGTKEYYYPLYDEADPNWWENHADTTAVEYEFLDEEKTYLETCLHGGIINYFRKLQEHKLQ